MENNQQEVDQQSYMDNAIRAVQQKKPIPEIDFTLHTMEDGTQVSTQERVCKGMLDVTALHAVKLAAAPLRQQHPAT
jgi:hypothetical protein